MTPILIQIQNRPGALAPSLTRASYLSYFENAQGEQWLIWRDALTQELFIAGSVLAWVAHAITPTWFQTADDQPRGCPFHLERDEKRWLIANWLALHGPLPRGDEHA